MTAKLTSSTTLGAVTLSGIIHKEAKEAWTFA